MPIPKPRADEERNDFIGRCISVLVDEGTDQEQAVAICHQAWRDRDKEPDMSDKLTKYITVKVEKANDDKRSLTAVGSIEKIDRDGEIVKVDGIDVKNYKKNPVVLWSHQYNSLPIAKATKVWKRAGKLNFNLEFATEKESPMAEYVYNSYKSGFMNSFSIGFMPDFNEVETNPNADGKKKPYRTYNKVELLEISAVPVPANADALMLRSAAQNANDAWEKGQLDGADMKFIEDEMKKAMPTEAEEQGRKLARVYNAEIDRIMKENMRPGGLLNSKEAEKTLLGAADKIDDLVAEKIEIELKLDEKDLKIAELEQKNREYEIKEELKEVETEDDYLAALFEEFDAEREEFDEYLNELLEE